MAELFDRMTAFSHLYAAYRRAARGSRNAAGTARFTFHAEKELLRLQEELLTGSYSPGLYRYFTIHDPKERLICVAPFRDRVVHHALVGALEPLFEKGFIFHSYASRVGKGTHRAVKAAQRFASISPWYFQADIHKYFDSIDHGILMRILERKTADCRLLQLAARILETSDRSRGISAGRGLPVGNLTSQFFANCYLDRLDHFVKQGLRARCYLRYMDDFLLFEESRELLKAYRDQLSDFLFRELGLELKPAATRLQSCRQGLNFLGVRIFPGSARLRNRNRVYMRRRTAARVREFRQGEISENQLAQSMQSVCAHLERYASIQTRHLFWDAVWGPPTKAPTVSNAAAAGTTTPPTVVQPIATTTTRPTATTTSASAFAAHAHSRTAALTGSVGHCGMYRTDSRIPVSGVKSVQSRGLAAKPPPVIPLSCEPITDMKR